MTPRVELMLLLSFYAVHAADLTVRYRTPWDCLWACHVACLFIAAGVARRSGVPAAIGMCWLALGNCLWILDLTTGGTLIRTSILTHVGGAWIGMRAVRRHGVPNGVWVYATLAMFGLVLVTRLLTPRVANVNLAFAVYPGWERVFSTYPRYFVFLTALCAVSYWLTERIARFLIARTTRPRTLAPEIAE